MSEIITCFCLADFEDKDYVPDSDDDISEDDRNFMRNTDYHAHFQAYEYDNSNDQEDPDIIYRRWWEENHQAVYEKRLYRGASFDGAYTVIFLNIKNLYMINIY